MWYYSGDDLSRSYFNLPLVADVGGNGCGVFAANLSYFFQIF